LEPKSVTLFFPLQPQSLISSTLNLKSITKAFAEPTTTTLRFDKLSIMSSIQFIVDPLAVHVNDEQVKIILDIASANIVVSITTTGLAEKLQRNLDNLRQAMSSPEDSRDGAQFILYDHCQLENRIVSDWNATHLQDGAILNDAGHLPRAERNYPLFHAARDTSLMWGFLFEWIQDDSSDNDSASIDSKGFNHKISISSGLGRLQLTASERNPSSSQSNAAIQGAYRPHKRQSKASVDAPSPNVPFPSTTANLTIIEILCFFPGWTTSRNVINRILSNGGSLTVVARILKEYRDMSPSVTGLRNTLLKRFNRHMRVVYGEDWIPHTHQAPPDYDHSNIDVSGFETVVQYEPNVKSIGPVQSVAFKGLANNISKFPSGSDALDLTRCVEYAIAHPDEEWRFPEDYEKILKHIGGPKIPVHDNLDNAIFRRHGNIQDSQTNDQDQSQGRSLFMVNNEQHQELDDSMVLDDGMGLQNDTVPSAPLTSTLGIRKHRRSSRLQEHVYSFKDGSEDDDDISSDGSEYDDDKPFTKKQRR
jgi:hypothetical protein